MVLISIIPSSYNRKQQQQQQQTVPKVFTLVLVSKLEMLTATEAWQDLPEYEHFYE